MSGEAKAHAAGWWPTCNFLKALDALAAQKPHVSCVETRPSFQRALRAGFVVGSRLATYVRMVSHPIQSHKH